jgi:uncharacterized membrane protein
MSAYIDRSIPREERRLDIALCILGAGFVAAAVLVVMTLVAHRKMRFAGPILAFVFFPLGTILAGVCVWRFFKSRLDRTLDRTAR